jgi:hypothetical protein
VMTEPGTKRKCRNAPARILACGDACFGTATACEQELTGLLVGGLQIIIDRLASLFTQFNRTGRRVFF